MELTKQCKQCNQEKHLFLFYSHGSMKDGRTSKCKECFIVAVLEARKRRLVKNKPKT